MNTLLPNIFPVTCHTDHVGPGSTFVAIKSLAAATAAADTLAHIKTALEKGASHIIYDQSIPEADIQALCKPCNATCIGVANTRKALAVESSKKLDNPSAKLKIIGVTGTKGKSTTAYLLNHIFRQAGYKTGLLSTIANMIGNKTEKSVRTTPESDYLQMFFAQCVEQKITHVIMEVSSHAIALNRTDGIMFDAVGFTNLYPDHLDFHPTIEDYFHTKTELFKQIKPDGILVINTDNDWGKKAYDIALAYNPNQIVVTFGTEPFNGPKHVLMGIDQASCDGIQLSLKMRPGLYVQCPQLFGMFNCYNIGLAVNICNALDVNYTSIVKALENFNGVPGRLQRHVLQNGAFAFVDYAHQPAAVREVLTTLRPLTTHLIVVFGCGGNRDKARRSGMALVASELADVIIVTDDNPRFEDRYAIIKDIIEAIPEDKKSAVITEPDRATAIATAASLARPDSIIALLGKGHETYYLINGQTHHFDDFEEISQF